MSSTKMPRQSEKSSTWPPMTGARMGARPLTIMRMAKKRVSSTPSATSRAMARAMTMPLAPAKPMRKRSTRKARMSGTVAQPSAVNAKTAMPASSGPLRP